MGYGHLYHCSSPAFPSKLLTYFKLILIIFYSLYFITTQFFVLHVFMAFCYFGCLAVVGAVQAGYMGFPGAQLPLGPRGLDSSCPTRAHLAVIQGVGRRTPDLRSPWLTYRNPRVNHHLFNMLYCS